MDRESAQRRIMQLVNEIEHHNKLYYQEDQPEIPDSHYDSCSGSYKN